MCNGDRCPDFVDENAVIAFFNLKTNISHFTTKPVFWVSDTNRAVQPQKMARGLKFRTKIVEELNNLFRCTKTKVLISRAVTAQLICTFVKAGFLMTSLSTAVTTKLISAFVFATRIVPFLYFINLKFQASSHLLWLYSPVCVGPSRKPRRPVFSQRGSIRCGFS